MWMTVLKSIKTFELNFWFGVVVLVFALNTRNKRIRDVSELKNTFYFSSSPAAPSSHSHSTHAMSQ